MYMYDDNLYDLSKIDFLKEVKIKYIMKLIYKFIMVLLFITQGFLFTMLPLSIPIMIALLLIQLTIILSSHKNDMMLSRLFYVYLSNFNDNLGKNIREVNKQIKQEKMKQKENNTNNKKYEDTNKFVDGEENNEVHVYKVADNNNFNNNVIDMELSNTYVKEKTLRKVKERRYK